MPRKQTNRVGLVDNKKNKKLETSEPEKTKEIESPAPTTGAAEDLSEVACESCAKQNFRALIEKYKAGHPAKYAQKEAEFIKKLNSL